MPNLSKSVLEALLPQGSIWRTKLGGGLDLLLDGISEGLEDERLFLSQLAFLRDPQKTTILDDLEREYGLVPNDSLTEQETRDRLQSKISNRQSDGTWLTLQNRLQEAGFDVLVHPNDPAANPDFFLNQGQFVIVANGELAICGNENAVCGVFSGIETELFTTYTGNPTSYTGNPDSFTGSKELNPAFQGELLVNQDFFDVSNLWSTVCAGEQAICGNQNATSGTFSDLIKTPIIYTVPLESSYWPLIFFVGGPATRDPQTGKILAIEVADIPAARRDEFRSIILQVKPMYSWAVLIVTYV